MDMRKENYLRLPYSKVVREMNDESGHYFYAFILELDGCHTTGDTEAEALKNLEEALEGYIEVKLENDLPISLPVSESDYSGKFVVRVPKSLHQRLVQESEKEGVSLNQYAMYKLAR